MSRLEAADSQQKMVRRCCICGEKKDKEAADSQIRFFRIPSSKSNNFNQWAVAIRALKNKPADRLKKNSIVCSKHFEKSCFFLKENTVKLKQGSLPTLNDPSIRNKNDTSSVEQIECVEATDIPDEESPTEKPETSSELSPEKEPCSPEKTQNKVERKLQPQNGHSSVNGVKTSEGSSESLSPPSLQPLPELNSDYEENVEEPPDLEIYSIGNDCEDASFLTNLSEYDAIKTDHIGSVADILGPDFLPDGPVPNEAERSEASSKAEIVEVDGQTILSFASAEELEEYVSHSEPTHQLAKTNDNTIENIVKLCQPTPSLTPSPCTSPFPSSQINLPADSATAALGTSSADVSSDTNRRSPIPSLSEDSTLPDQEICSIMEGDSVKRNAAETSRDVEESKPGNETGGEEQNSDNERAEDHSNVLRYSESDDSITDAVEAQLGEERVTVKIESDSFCDDNVKGSPPESSPCKALPALKTDGTITPEVAAFAVSAITLSPQPAPAITLPKPASIAPKKPNGPGRGRRSGSVSSINRPGRRSEPSIFDKSAPSDEADEILNVDMAVNETAFENLVVHDEEYTEEYDVPVEIDLQVGACGKLACRLGCICTSLEEAGSRRKQPSEHCSLPECMLECVCGYKRGKLTGSRSFVSLLKGNESFYSKINWTNERSRRERKVPERYSEYQLETDTIKQSNNGRGSSSRTNSRPASPTYKPPSTLGRQYQPRSARNQQNQPVQNQAQQTTPTASPKKKERFKLKISADEIKLLRWDSYVSLSKVYVAPDQEVMCMDHLTYNCPCIASNRRIIRIPSKFVPPEVRIADGAKSNQASGAQPSSNGSRNVAKKHTHPLMRTPLSNSKEKRGGDLYQSSDEAPKPSAMSKMRKLLQDERFQLQKLITQEKTRAFDDEIDLTLQQGQTVQLVAWIRFHSIYHAGKMHIRFLSRRSGPVILVMRPNEIVAADITCDIQDMKGKVHAPEIVKELLDPCISPEETSRYAFILCDGVKWELVGCLSLQISNPSNSTEKASPPSQSAAPAASSPSSRNQEPATVDESELPSPDVSSRSTPTKQMSDAVDPESSAAISPATQRRLDAMEERRRVLEEKLEKINSRLNFQPPKVTPIYKPSKPKPPSWATVQRATTPDPSKPTDEESGNSTAPSVPAHGTPAAQTKEPCESAHVPEHSMLPDILPAFFTRPTFMNDMTGEENRPFDYFASEQLIRFSQLVMETRKNYFKEFNSSAKRLQSLKESASSSTSPTPTIPKEARRITEMSLLKDTSSIDYDDSSTSDQRDFQSIRIGPQQATTPGTNSTFPTQRIALEAPVGGTPLAKPGSAGLPSTLLVRKLATNGPSMISSQPGNTILLSNTKLVAGSLSGVVPTSASSVLKVTTVGSLPAQKGGLPKISSVSSIAFGEVTPGTPSQNLKPTLVQVGGQIIAAKPIIFPEAVSIEVSPVQMFNSRAPQLFSHRMKVVLEAMAGEHKALCPSRTNMLLPLHNNDDEWSLVAVDPVPQPGLPVPGLQVIVPRLVLEKALSTATERQARVSFPLHVQGIPSNPVLKKGFGVYATPQLPRHAFLGPFPANYLKSRPALPVYIKLLSVTPEARPASKSVAIDPIVIELGCSPVSSPTLDDSVVIEKVVGNPSQSSESSTGNTSDAISIEPANGPDPSATTDLSCPEKFPDVFKSSDDNPSSPLEDSLFISTGTDFPSNEVEEIEDLPGGLNISISKVESTKQMGDENENSDAETVEDAFKGNDDLGSITSDSDDPDYADSTEKNWQDSETRWLESVAYLNRNSKSNSPLDPDQLSQDIIIEPVESDSTRNARASYSRGGRRKRLADETAEGESLLPRRSPKRTRRPTEKARMFAEELKAGRSSSASSHSSYAETRRQASFSPPPSSRRSMFQRELHIRKEQERRGLLGKLFRDLDSLIAPNSGPRSKIVVLKHATNTLKALEEQSKEMDNLYGLLKARRNTLLRQRFKLFNELPSDVKPIFKCLLDSTPLPERHLSVEAMTMKRHKSSARQSEADGSQNGYQDHVDDVDVTDY